MTSLCMPVRVKYICKLSMLLAFLECFTVCGGRSTLPEQSVVFSPVCLVLLMVQPS